MSKPGISGDTPVAPPASVSPPPASPPPSADDDTPDAPGLNVATAGVVLLTVVVLYFGRDIFIPFVLAVLLSFLLARPVEWLRRLHVPRAPAVVLVVACAMVLIGGVSVLVGSQVVSLANNLPAYQKTMQTKIRTIREAAVGGGAIDRTAQVIQALGRELSAKADGEKVGLDTDGHTAKPEPVPVRIETDAQQRALETLRNVVGPVLGPMGTAGLVIVFVFFVLLQPSDLRDRFIRLAGSDLHRTTEALSEAAERVSRYLLMQLVVNATYGIPVGIGLYLIGVPGAFLWGLLATLLRFIPYLGPVIAAAFPLTMAFAVDPGWTMLLWAALLILIVELVSNNVVEPLLYGSGTGLTPVAVILAAIFWTLLWGPVGLFLATPLTVCLVVMGRYVPQLTFLDVLLGSDPVLQPEERLYQRLLAGNIEEAIDIGETAVAETSLTAFYDEVGLPALRLAEHARERGASVQDRKRVADGIRAVVRDLRDFGEQDTAVVEPPAGVRREAQVLCLAGRGELDDAAAAMLTHLLEDSGIAARMAPASSLTPDAIGSLNLAGVEVLCLSYLHPMPHAYARFVCRRLKRRRPGMKIVLGLWNLAAPAGSADQLASRADADFGAKTLTEATQAIQQMIQPVAARSANVDSRP